MTGDQKSRTVHRDGRTGRFARHPVEGVDAESRRFNPMGDAIEDIDNVSGSPSPSTIDHARYSPAGDTLAGAGPSYGSSPLRSRRPELVSEADAAHDVYGKQGAVLRAAARPSAERWDDPTAYLVGLESHGTPATGVRTVDDGD